MPNYRDYEELRRGAQAGDPIAIAVLEYGRQIAEEAVEPLSSIISEFWLNRREARHLMRRVVREAIIQIYRDAIALGMDEAIDDMETRLRRIAREIYERDYKGRSGPLGWMPGWLRRLLPPW